MPDNFDNLWLQQSLHRNATNRALEQIQATGQALPCRVTAVDGSIVTVSFEVTGPQTLPPLTLPKAESQWLRAPTQIGDFGLTLPADTFLGGISGLGSGVADLSVDYGNMTTLVWVPVSAVGFSAAPDQNKAWVNGPAGVVISDTEQTITVIIDKATGTLQIGGSGTDSDDAVVRRSDLQAALNALVTAIHTWAMANFTAASHGTGWTGTAPTSPTATASDITFTA